jgi:hemerythrin superfamily protein
MNSFLQGFFGLSGEDGDASHEDVVQILKADHRRVEELFTEFEKTKNDGPARRKILKKIITELEVHATVEEELVYPEAEADAHVINEANEEHHVVKLLIAELKQARSMNDAVDAKVKVLKEMVQHHVKEEEGILLPKLPQDELQEIGAKVRVRKEEILGKEFPEKHMYHAGVQPVEDYSGPQDESTAKPKTLKAKPKAVTKKTVARKKATTKSAPKTAGAKSTKAKSGTKTKNKSRKSAA